MAPISYTSANNLNWQNLAGNIDTKITGNLTLIICICDGYRLTAYIIIIVIIIIVINDIIIIIIIIIIITTYYY